MLITRPQRRFFMPGSAALVAWKTEVRLIAITASQRSAGNSSTGDTCWMPALLTRMSTAPNSVSAAFTRSAISAGFDMSAPWKRTFPPWAFSSELRSASISSPSPKPFSITLAPSAAKSVAIARPMPLVDPVTTADFPASCLLIVVSCFSSGSREAPPGRRRPRWRRDDGPLTRFAKHLDVHDAVLVVRLGALHEAEFPVEAVEVPLRPDADVLARPERMDARNRFAHQLAARPGAASLPGRQHAANGRFRILAAGGEEAAVGDERTVVPSQQVPRLQVVAVHVLERAVLFENEDTHPGLVQVVDLPGGEVVEASETPAQHSGASINNYGLLCLRQRRRFCQVEPGFHHRVRIQRHRFDAFGHQTLGEVGIVARALAADADVLVGLAAGLDRQVQHAFHRGVALVEGFHHQPRIAVEREGELGHVVRADREAVEMPEEVVGKDRV